MRGEGSKTKRRGEGRKTKRKGDGRKTGVRNIVLPTRSLSSLFRLLHLSLSLCRPLSYVNSSPSLSLSLSLCRRLSSLLSLSLSLSPSLSTYTPICRSVTKKMLSTSSISAPFFNQRKAVASSPSPPPPLLSPLSSLSSLFLFSPSLLPAAVLRSPGRSSSNERRSLRGMLRFRPIKRATGEALPRAHVPPRASALSLLRCSPFQVSALRAPPRLVSKRDSAKQRSCDSFAAMFSVRSRRPQR